jgi:hypothetical protein
MCSELTDSQVNTNDIVWQIKEDFYQHPNYYSIYKNSTPSVNYDVLIQSGDTKDKNVPYKLLTSYPYDTFSFDTGDYIHWTYGGVSSTWLMFALDKQYLHACTGRIYKCNNNLKWVDDNGITRNYPCVVGYGIRESRTDERKNIVIPDGIIVVTVQSNTYTQSIIHSDRFLLGTNGEYNAYRVNAIQNITDENLIEFTMFYEALSANDDIVNGIADKYENSYTVEILQPSISQVAGYTGTLTATVKRNGIVVTEGVTWSSSNVAKVSINNSGNYTLVAIGSAIITCAITNQPTITDTVTLTVVANLPVTKQVVISPDVTSIKQNVEQTYTVYKYTDNVVNVDTFTFTASGVTDTSYYTLTTINGNSFKVKCLKYNVTPLVITCVSAVDATTKTISINLKSLW